MLDERANGRGDHLPVVSLLLGPALMAAQSLGPVDDRGQGDVDAATLQAIAEGGVVIGRDREIAVVDQGFFPKELLADVVFGGLGESRWTRAQIGDRKSLGVSAKLLQESEEVGSVDA